MTPGTEFTATWCSHMTDTDRSVLATVIDSMIALEREACAKIAEGEAERICKHIAAAIRARGTP